MALGIKGVEVSLVLKEVEDGVKGSLEIEKKILMLEKLQRF